MDRRYLLKLSSLAAVSAGAGSAQAASPPRSSRELLKAFVDALTAHDMPRFRALYVDDGYVQHQALVMASGATSGPDAAVKYFAQRIAAFPDLTVSSDVSLFDGDLISANLIYTGTHKGEYLGFAPTGRKVVFNSTDIMKISNGRFVEHWGAADLYGLSQQLRG